MNKFKRVGLWSGVVASMAAVAPAVLAQGAAPTLEEIVVTAQKRTERLQDVPLSITALTTERIENMGAASFTDYARTVPGLSFIDRGPGRNAITIRGITTGANQGREALVGVYFDDMPVSAPSFQPDLNLFDIESVQVMRGPQGTLYGAGAMGGAIKLVPAKPDSESFSAKLDATLSTTRHASENYRLNGMVNLPLVEDRLALRAVAYQRDESGYIRNVALGRSEVNDEDTRGGRVALQYTPDDRLTVTGSALYQKTKVGGTQEANLALGPLLQDRRVEEPREDEYKQYNLTLKYALAWGELTSSTTYFDRDFSEGRDVSAVLGGQSIVAQLNTLPIESVSQEFRLASTDDSDINWLLGAFYIKQEDKLLQLVSHDGFAGIPAFIPLLENEISNELTQYALFGEVGFKLTDTLQATLGLRWFDVDQDYSRAASGPLAGGESFDIGKASQSKINPKVVLSWSADDDVMVYAQAAQGFRVGGPNPNMPPDPATGELSPSEYSADTLWNYELGIKTSWLENRVSVNAAAFYIDWEDIQVTVFRSDGFSFVGNAAEASSKGLELELAARPLQGLDLRAALSYTDASLEQDVPGLGGVKGDRIPFVPRENASLSARYSFPMSAGLTGFGQFDYQYVGSSYNAFNRDFADQQGSYGLGALRGGVETDAWAITLFADNLFDKRADLFVDTLLGDKRANVNRPRTVGVSVRANFQ